MRKSLPLLVAVLALALVGSSAFAFAPVMQPLPDVWIGDSEDNAGTVDNNLFRFSDAFDLDAYVDDQDTTISELVWSFYEMGAGNLEVNGITELADPADAVNADSLGKDIRHASAPYDDEFVDFWDLKDSPLPLSLPYPTPTDPLDEVVTFYVSDGAFVDSGQCVVRADDGGVDRVSDTTAWVRIGGYDYEGTPQGWTFTGPSVNAADASYAGATSTYNSAALGTTTDNATSRFGFWSGPDSFAVASGNLYRFVWNVYTDQANNLNVPTVRFRMNAADFSYAYEVTLASANATENPYLPSPTPRDYNMYMTPYNAQPVFPTYDVYDFDAADAGTVYLEQLDVYQTALPATGWTAETVPAFGSWSALTSITPYGAVSSGTTGGLQLTSSVSNGFNYGFWNSAANIPISTGNIYRVLATVASSDASPPQALIRTNSADAQVSARFTASSLSAAPDADGEVYPIYFGVHEQVSGQEGFNISFEIGDFDSARGGTITLTDVTVESHAVIP
jgi:hypothetical protein